MKKSIKFLIAFVFVFIICMLAQMNTNKVMAYDTYTTYTYGDIEYRWNQDGYWMVDGISNDNAYIITIPSYIEGYPVKEISFYALEGNDNIVSVYIPNTVESIEKSAFSHCEGLESITIPSNVKTIGENAFGFCENLSHVKLNEGLEIIGAKAFQYTALTSIEIPSTVQVIGVDAFYRGSRKYVTFYGIKGTVAESYANKYANIFFQAKELPFVDVSIDSWYYNAVKYVYSKEIMTGYTYTKFAPNDKLTRGMFISILYKKEGAPYASADNRFVDVSSDAYYAKAVTWGVNNKIISGYDNTHFGPNDNITREQIAVILQQYCKYKGDNSKSTGNLTQYSDYRNVSDYATWGMKWAVGTGVITGSNGRLNPKSYATRAEAAAMMQKYCYSFK